MEEVEIWKPVEGFEERYKISNLGILYKKDYYSNNNRFVKGGVIKSRLNHKGYLQVVLIGESKRLSTSIHRILAKAFIPNLENKPQINHINGIKTDNRLENLEWCNNSENQLHALKTGLKKYPKGELNSNTCLTELQVTTIKEAYNKGEKLPFLAKEYNISSQIIRNIIYGITWRHNTSEIIKRDDRKDWSNNHTKNSLISKFNNKSKTGTIVVEQYTENGEEIARFRSINQAALKTGIPRKSIEAVVNKKRFPHKDGSFYTMKKAGNFKWRKIEIDLEQFKNLICEI